MNKLMPLALLLLSIHLVSCSHEEEIKQLKLSLQEVTDTLETCQNEVRYRQQTIDSLYGLVQQTQAAITNDSIAVSNYLDEHRMAVLCIVTGNVSAQVQLDFQRDYPQWADEASGWGLVLSIGYYLFNQEEVDEVYNTATEADTKKKQLSSYMESWSEDISNEQYALNSARTLQSTYEYKSSSIQQKISKLE